MTEQTEGLQSGQSGPGSHNEASGLDGGLCTQREEGGRGQGRGSPGRRDWTLHPQPGARGPPLVVRGPQGERGWPWPVVSPSPERLVFPDPLTPCSVVAGPGRKAQDAADPARHGLRCAPRAGGH